MSDTKIIDGKIFSNGLKEKIKAETKSITEKTGKMPGLAVVLVGDDPASKVYVSNKIKTTKELGMNSFATFLPGDTSEEELLNKVRELNADETVHGILVQFPVPDQISQQKVIDTIAPEKDVDGLHPISAGRLSSGLKGLVSCTPLGCSMLVKDQLGEDLSGQHAVVIGRSNLVGKPVAQLLLQANATVTIAHSRTKDLPALCREADILIAAVGRPEMVKADWVKDGACVIDVGINRIPAPERGEGKTRLVGDVDYNDVFERAGSITPVPGGVGPMTIACLLHNTLEAFKDIEGI